MPHPFSTSGSSCARDGDYLFFFFTCVYTNLGQKIISPHSNHQCYTHTIQWVGGRFRGWAPVRDTGWATLSSWHTLVGIDSDHKNNNNKTMTKEFIVWNTGNISLSQQCGGLQVELHPNWKDTLECESRYPSGWDGRTLLQCSSAHSNTRKYRIRPQFGYK